MKPTVIISTVILALATSAPNVVRAATPGPPPIGSVVRSTAIKGVAGGDVIVYRRNGLRLGAVIQQNGVPRLVWSRSLPADPARLSSPGPNGLIEGIVRFSDSQKAQVFAYIVRPSRVVSAIPDRPSGDISASEGANFHGLNFTLKEPDAGHVGSVKYRLETTYYWKAGMYSRGVSVRVPDYVPSAYPVPNATVTTKAGDMDLIRLEIADTEALRQTGLMYRTSLDADTGMIFVWPYPVLESFWMENTYIPLSIAFLGSDGKVQGIQAMDALTMTLHTPASPYQYAIEANLGYFKAMGIAPGDTMDLHLAL